MKRFLLLCLSLLPIGATGLLAQSECLPQNYSIIFGGGVSLPHVEGNRNDFFSKNGNRVGYDLMTEGRYYITPLFAAGLQYDYLRMARLPDKAHLHCIRPNITYRPLWSNGNQGLFLSFGIGYMNYQERTYKRGERNGHLFHKGYCGITFAAGYEFRISRKLSGMIRCDFLTADWFANPDARLYNTDGYDDGVNFPLYSLDFKQSLDVHHKVYRKKNGQIIEPWEYDDKDLETLCHSCHLKKHKLPIYVINE